MLGDVDMDDGVPADSGGNMSDMQFPTLKSVKREMGGKIGRPRKLAVYNPREMMDGNVGEDNYVAGPSTALHSDSLFSSGKRRKQHLPFTIDDLDIMCAVPSPRSGAPCRQPLTCKSHSISSKRAVAGRRKPFDSLLQDLKENHSRKSPQDIPRPLATKIYCSSHNQRMRAVIASLYRESTSGRWPSQNEHLAPETNQDQQQQHMLMSLNKGLQ